MLAVNSARVAREPRLVRRRGRDSHSSADAMSVASCIRIRTPMAGRDVDEEHRISIPLGLAVAVTSMVDNERRPVKGPQR
jgi:hypothetical protein